MAAARPKSVSELFGLPSPPKTGRERLVAAAIELFYRHGFGAVGIDRVIAAAGVTKTTFYKHFEGKDDLMVAAVRRRDEWEFQAWGRAVRKLAGDDSAAQFLAMLDVMDVWFNDPDFGGCLFLNTALEFPDPQDPVHRAAVAYKRRGSSRAPSSFGWRTAATMPRASCARRSSSSCGRICRRAATRDLAAVEQLRTDVLT